MFPKRSEQHEDIKKDIGLKYSEKAVFHIKQKQDDNNNQTTGLRNNEDQDQSDFSNDEIGDEIMMNFNIMRNFEMKRSRAEKNQYDSKVFGMYVKEVFDAILSKEYLFLKAFSKPIQKDFLECLTKLHYHGILEEYQEDIDNSILNDIDDQSWILTIDLYLSLEKKREEENDRLRKLDVDEILSSKMPSNLFKPSKGKYDKTHIKNKLSLFTEWEHIHNKAIFDSINEALNLFRPHGKKGEPLPWTGRGGFMIDYTKTDVLASQILSLVNNILLDWNSFKGGPLPWKEFYHNNQFDEEHFADFREKKLASILAYEVEKEDQNRWLDYETEESQIKLDLGDIILDRLIEEIVDILGNIGTKDSIKI